MRKFFLATLLAHSPFLLSTTYTWNVNGNAAWNLNTSWTPAGFPTSSADTAIMKDQVVATVTTTVNAAPSAATNVLQFGVATGNTVTAFTLSGAGPLTFSTPATNATIQILAGGTRSHTISCPVALNLPAGVLQMIHNGTATGDLTISGLISGSGGITKSTSGVGSVGVLRLSNASNSYLGATSINSGTISYQANGCIPANNVVTVGSGIGAANSSQLIMTTSMTAAKAFSLTVKSPDGLFTQNNGITVELLSLAGNGNIALSTTNVNADLFDITGNSPTNTTFSGVISGGFVNTSNNFTTGNRITKTGTSTQTFSGANTYTSRTFIASGILSATQDASLGAPATNSGVYARSGATLELGAGPLTLAQPVFLNGSGVLGAGALHNKGNNTIGPGIYGTTSKLTIGWSGSSEVSADATIQLDPGTTLTIPDQIVGTKNVTFFGGGTATYTGAIANTQSGQTIVGTAASAATLILNKTPGVNAIDNSGSVLITNGELRLANLDQISNGAPVTIEGPSATFNLNGNPEVISSLTFNQGTLSQGGALLSLLSAGTSASTALTMRGGTTINGPIRISSAGKIIFDASGGTAPATISSLASLAINRGFPDTDVFDIQHVPAATVDMQIDAPISQPGSTISIQKIGAGILVFGGSAANTYGGITTVSAGTLSLAKSTNNVAIPGDLLINGGILKLAAAEQIADSSLVEIDSGSFTLNSFNETVKELKYFGGTLDQTLGGTLSLNDPTTALVMYGTTVTGNVQTTGGGSINFDQTGGIAPGVFASTSTLDLKGAAAFTTAFNIDHVAASTVDMQILGSIINSGVGAASIQKNGTGILEFGGSAANTYSGLTTVSAGTLRLAKSVSNVAIPKDLLINGGTLSLAAAEQISNSSLVELDSGTFLLNGFNETIKEFKYFGGTLDQTGGGTLILNDATTALVMRDTTINGAIQILNAGAVVFDNTNNGTAQILGPLDLNNNLVEFAVPTSSATYGMIVGSNIASGGVKKTQAGRLSLTGTNSYPLGTQVLAGVLEGNSLSLQGNILNNATLVFNQNFSGTFSGAFSGPGAFQKTGSDLLILSGSNSSAAAEVVSGELQVNGLFSGGNVLTVDAPATLSGNGTIQKNVDLFGRISPGVGFDTLSVIGSVNFEPGSTTQIEISPSSSDKLFIQGPLTIQPNTVLNLLLFPGEYTVPSLYQIIDTTGGVSGTFSSVLPPIPLVNAFLFYSADDVLLEIGFKQISSVITKGNAAKVAHCLDGFDPPQGSDLAIVINDLRLSPTIQDLQEALDEISPSQMTALALAQENSTVDMRNNIYNRLEGILHSCICQDRQLSFWGSVFGSYTDQSDTSTEWGFRVKTPGVSIGVDTGVGNDFTLGLGTGYTHSDLKWRNDRGDAEIDTVYGNLYGAWEKCSLFLEGALMGGYNWYEAVRHIKFVSFSPLLPRIDRKARDHHRGYEFSAHLKGAWRNWCSNRLVPYASLDYLFLHEDGYREKGADSLNLHMHHKNSNLLLSELGIDFSHSKQYCSVEFAPFIQVSVIRESRWQGAHQESDFYGCHLDVKGMNPSRTLFGAGIGVDFGFNCGSFISLFAKGKYGRGFQDTSIYLEFVY